MKKRPLMSMATSVLVVTGLSVGVAACGDDETGDDGTTTTVTVVGAEVTVTDPADGSVTINPSFSIDGVLAAAVLLAEGDADLAVAEGVVTVVEVDAAARAISDGTLDTWVTAAGG